MGTGDLYRGNSQEDDIEMVNANTTLEHIQQRSSIRRYERTPLTYYEITKLKKAVLAAPTARDLQELRYYFVTDQSVLKQIDECIFRHASCETRQQMISRGTDSFFYNAPLAVIITAKNTRWADADAGIAIGILSIAAQSMGLGSVILGFPAQGFIEGDPDNCCKLLRFEEGEQFRLAIAIGHPATQKEPHKQNPDLIRDI